jgi:hypothetical protein
LGFSASENDTFTASAIHSVLFQSPWPTPKSRRFTLAVPSSLAVVPVCVN